MDISVARRVALVLVCLVLFSTCGELDTLFPSNSTYQVRTLVNGNSLDECSIIRSNDKVHFYFAGSVANDPDLVGLLVYLQDTQGKVVGDKVQYTLLPYADNATLTEEDLSELGLSDLEGNLETPEPEKTRDAEFQIYEQLSIVDSRSVEKKSDVEIAVASFSQKLPIFSLPNDLKIGSYVLVYEAVGKSDTLSRMEADIYYLGSAKFNLKDVSMYPSGLSGPQLISPETIIMLETSLDFDSSLDPYLIWYNDKNIISEGKISDGAGQLLWKAPEQPGFYSLRLEAFPFPLNRRVYTGISRNIALPISSKAISLSYFFENSHEEYPESTLLQWYQFDGSLRSFPSILIEEQTLLPVKETLPRWAAAGQSYGLAIGPDDPYQLPPVNFFHEGTDRGGGILLLHIRPLSEGIIFNAFFPLQSAANEGVSMDIIKKDSDITLRLTAAGASVELPVYYALPATEGFIPIAVEFYIQPYSFEAKINIDINHQSQIGKIRLSDTLSGEGKIRLGGNEFNAEEIYSDTIWDELAILYSDTNLDNSIKEREAQVHEAQVRETHEVSALTVSSENY